MFPVRSADAARQSNTKHVGVEFLAPVRARRLGRNRFHWIVRPPTRRISGSAHRSEVIGQLAVRHRPRPVAKPPVVRPVIKLPRRLGHLGQDFLGHVGSVGVLKTIVSAVSVDHRRIRIRKRPPGFLVPGVSDSQQEAGPRLTPGVVIRHCLLRTGLESLRNSHKEFLPGQRPGGAFVEATDFLKLSRKVHMGPVYYSLNAQRSDLLTDSMTNNGELSMATRCASKQSFPRRRNSRLSGQMGSFSPRIESLEDRTMLSGGVGDVVATGHRRGADLDDHRQFGHPARHFAVVFRRRGPEQPGDDHLHRLQRAGGPRDRRVADDHAGTRRDVRERLAPSPTRAARTWPGAWGRSRGTTARASR